MKRSIPWHPEAAGPPLSLGRILAAGKNYAAHVAAMADGPAPARPVLFAKSPRALRLPGEPLWCPPGCEDLHPEAELVVIVGQALAGATRDQAAAAIAGYAAGIDLTDRGWQRQAKQAGHPWEWAKAFDGSAALSPVVAADAIEDWASLRVRLRNGAGALLQEADPAAMTMDPAQLLAYASERFHLDPGDLLFTGAPAGTAPVQAGETLELELAGWPSVRFEVSAERLG